ncbi:MAG: ATP-dependent Clp protease adapter ClpS [Desulfobacterales bacterium]
MHRGWPHPCRPSDHPLFTSSSIITGNLRHAAYPLKPGRPIHKEILSDDAAVSGAASFSGETTMSDYTPELEGDVASETRSDVTEPPLYRVLLINDDYTTMDFVVEILRSVFNKPTEAAMRIMLNVHHAGAGLCGVYAYEIAETKVDTVHTLAREHGFPLKSTMEKE